MDIFLSWSGDRSKMIALTLRDWLPLVIDHVNPWFSGTEIRSGSRWSLEVGENLQRINFGILCLTRDNLQSPWLLFEAGALSKALEEGAVCPYLFDLEISEVTGPLSQFQAKKAEKASTLEMILDINKQTSDPSDESLLTKRFAAFWPELETALGKIPEGPDEKRATPTRPEPEILEELVGRIRNMDRRFISLVHAVDQLRSSTRVRPAVVSQLRERKRQDVHVTILIGEGIQTKVPEGESVDFGTPRLASVIPAVAHLTGLDEDDYMVDWVLKDSFTGEPFIVAGEYSTPPNSADGSYHLTLEPF